MGMGSDGFCRRNGLKTRRVERGALKFAKKVLCFNADEHAVAGRVAGPPSLLLGSPTTYSIREGRHVVEMGVPREGSGLSACAIVCDDVREHRRDAGGRDVEQADTFGPPSLQVGSPTILYTRREPRCRDGGPASGSGVRGGVGGSRTVVVAGM